MLTPVDQIQNYIDGRLTGPAGGQYFDNAEPATGEMYSRIPDSDGRDVEAAVEAARKAFPAWSLMPAEKRSALMMKVADLIESNLETLARAESVDTGKPITLARTVDIPRAVSNFRFFASGFMHFASESHALGSEAINYTLRRPVGVAGCISPWNLPLYLFTWKIAPALAAGNCVVAKPSEVTPATAFLLSQLCIEAGLPPGVLNIVHGYGSKAGDAIVRHPEIKAISFTGGTKTGQQIASLAAPMFKKLSLELGGKNPNIIFADCDFDKAVGTSVHSSFSNQGQICLCGSRIFIEESIYGKFKTAFLEKVKRIKTGDPLEEDTRHGAVVSRQHMEKVLFYIDLAGKEGGKILCGGKQFSPGGRCAGGFFIEPTVIEGLPYDCRTNQEEIFGPVVTLIPFKNEEEALLQANSTGYGLCAMVWTENLTRAHRMAERLETGIIWVNCWLVRDLRTPFGGWKNSGVGREGGWDSFRFFTEPKNVCIKLQ